MHKVLYELNIITAFYILVDFKNFLKGRDLLLKNKKMDEHQISQNSEDYDIGNAIGKIVNE